MERVIVVYTLEDHERSIYVRAWFMLPQALLYHVQINYLIAKRSVIKIIQIKWPNNKQAKKKDKGRNRSHTAGAWQCLSRLVESDYTNLIFPWIFHPFLMHVPAKYAYYFTPLRVEIPGGGWTALRK